MLSRSTASTIFVACFGYVFFLTNCTFGQLDQNTIRFVGDVLVGTEFDSKADQVAMRWESKPRLSTFGPASHHPSIVTKVVSQLNECLPEHARIQFLGANDDTATIKVYFVAYAQFANVAKQNGFVDLPDNWGYFRVSWDANYRLNRSVVLIANDKLRGRRLEHYLLEEITQSLGLAGDSIRFSESVFYENENDERKNHRFGTATTLTRLDRKLIKFLYEFVPPGTPPVELGVLLARHWE